MIYWVHLNDMFQKSMKLHYYFYFVFVEQMVLNIVLFHMVALSFVIKNLATGYELEKLSNPILVS